MNDAFKELMSPKKPKALPSSPKSKPPTSPRKIPRLSQAKRVECPVCGKNLSINFMSIHLDLDCPKENSKYDTKRKLESQNSQEVVKHARLDFDEDDLYDLTSSLELNNNDELPDIPSQNSFIAPISSSAATTSRFQASLNSFLNIPIYDPPTYFILSWPPGSTSPTAVFTNTPLSYYTFQARIKWREIGSTITLQTKLPIDPPTWKDITPKTYYTNVPFLKSHLQKCIRRRKADLAVRTAWEMARVEKDRDGISVNGLEQLLRRIPIICIEDVTLHSFFPVLIWLMSAYTKGFQISTDFISWVLGFVKALAEHPFHDSSSIKPIPGRKTIKINSKEVLEGQYKDDQCRDILYAIALRKAFGGNKDDMNMLANAYTSWHHRLITTSSSPFTLPSPLLISDPPTPISPTNLAPLQMNEWELLAIDFHCSNILNLLEIKLPEGMEKSDVQSMMWRFGGGWNDREIAEENSDNLEKTQDKGTEKTNEEEEKAIWDNLWESIIKPLAKAILVKRK